MLNSDMNVPPRFTAKDPDMALAVQFHVVALVGFCRFGRLKLESPKLRHEFIRAPAVGVMTDIGAPMPMAIGRVKCSNSSINDP